VEDEDPPFLMIGIVAGALLVLKTHHGRGPACNISCWKQGS
jgi:hypothetical protein